VNIRQAKKCLYTVFSRSQSRGMLFSNLPRRTITSIWTIICSIEVTAARSRVGSDLQQQVPWQMLDNVCAHALIKGLCAVAVQADPVDEITGNWLATALVLQLNTLQKPVYTIDIVYKTISSR
jgi:hypothetical protein